MPFSPRMHRREMLQTLSLGVLGAGSLLSAETSKVRITGIETIALLDPGKYAFTLVRVHTDAGIDGIGQAESPSLVIDAAIKSGLEALLKGEDPLEAPLPPDNLDGYRRLADSTDIRIAAGDWGFTSRFEYLDLMDRGGIDVVQPSTVRSGGIAEIVKIAEMAYRKGLTCITHSWNQMVGVAAAVHIAAVLPNEPYFEFPLAYPNSPMITELLVPQLQPDSDGWIEVPKRPGLGFTLNEEVLQRFRTKLS